MPADYLRDYPPRLQVSTHHKREQRSPLERKYIGVFRGSLDAALRDSEGGRVRKRNKLRRWLAQTLEGDRGFIFSGRKSKRYAEETDD